MNLGTLYECHRTIFSYNGKILSLYECAMTKLNRHIDKYPRFLQMYSVLFLFMTVILLILAIIDSQLLSISAKIREKD
jgi:hypothetical protein